MSEVTVEGVAADRFTPVRDALAASLKGGDDLGASFCATVEGETVVDLWGGWADERRTRPWEEDTIVNVYSTTKTMTALTALVLADRGALDFDAPVARYWPEFAANGKERVKVSHLMSHASGLSGWTAPMTKEDLYDWEKATALLAAQAPLWQPGTAPGYHAMTQGYLVGEVVRRVTGASLGQVFRAEIAKPLGADFHIGLPASEDDRVADLIPPAPMPAPETDPRTAQMIEIANATQNKPPHSPLDTRTRAWRAAEIPAAGGHGNARSIAEIHALLANGGTAKGKRLISEAGCRKALDLQIEGVDLVLGMPIRYGMGFGLAGGLIPLPSPNSIFWGGYGGSLVIIDMDARTTFAFAMNKMFPTTMGDTRAGKLVAASLLGLSAKG